MFQYNRFLILLKYFCWINTPKIILFEFYSRGRRIFSELDINDDGQISCEEFVRGCMHDQELVRIITAGGIDPLEEDADWCPDQLIWYL